VPLPVGLHLQAEADRQTQHHYCFSAFIETKDADAMKKNDNGGAAAPLERPSGVEIDERHQALGQKLVRV
jgi:hypothetical protein